VLGPWVESVQGSVAAVLCVQQDRIHYCGLSGRDSSVAIAARYGLDGPGIESRRGARFSVPVQTPIQWVPGLSRG
jgi:hypothetical protein